MTDLTKAIKTIHTDYIAETGEDLDIIAVILTLYRDLDLGEVQSWQGTGMELVDEYCALFQASLSEVSAAIQQAMTECASV